MKKKVVYKWLGKAEFVPGVPARDLTKEDLEREGVEALAKASKLYKKVSEKSDEK
jgi:hypothetical protein